MRNGSNRWYDAIMKAIDTSIAPMTPDQIWGAIEATGFRHESKSPRSTLGARLAELREMKTIERVGNVSLYRRATPSHAKVDDIGHLSENAARG